MSLYIDLKNPKTISGKKYKRTGLSIKQVERRSQIQQRSEEVFRKTGDQQVMVMRNLITYSYFGEEDILKKKSRSYNAVCTSDCELYTLDKIVGSGETGTRERGEGRVSTGV